MISTRYHCACLNLDADDVENMDSWLCSGCQDKDKGMSRGIHFPGSFSFFLPSFLFFAPVLSVSVCVSFSCLSANGKGLFRLFKHTTHLAFKNYVFEYKAQEKRSKLNFFKRQTLAFYPNFIQVLFVSLCKEGRLFNIYTMTTRQIKKRQTSLNTCFSLRLVGKQEEKQEPKPEEELNRKVCQTT